MATNYNAPFDPPLWRPTIWAITAVFESGHPEGNPAAYQTYDSGIISYGKHQATLASGNLWRILDAYFQRSQTPTAMALRNEYAGRVQNGDASLRNDERIKALLLQAATEPAMSDAQDSVFDSNFYQPAIQRAQELGIRTPLGLACIYDTRIQGGFKYVFEAVANKLGGGGVVGATGNAGVIEEDVWINTFLNEREAYLNRLANKAESDGRTADAKALRTSTFRVTEIRTQAQARNFGLTGQFKIRGQTINGIGAGSGGSAATTSSSPASGSQGQTNGCQFLADATLPDDTVLKTGQSFVKSWSVKNTGQKIWGPNYRVVYMNGDGPMSETSRQVVPLAKAGDQVLISIPILVPAPRPEPYISSWRMQDDQGVPFGDFLWIKFYARAS
jgi:hypothetical protein